MKYVLTIAMLLCCGNVYAIPTANSEQIKSEAAIVPTIKFFRQHRPVRKFIARAFSPVPPQKRAPKNVPPVVTP